jgi:Leu/Phe-tRNA-protein transferase
MMNPYLSSMGAEEISRKTFLQYLKDLVKKPGATSLF